MTAEVERDSARQGVVWTPEHAAEHVRGAYGREVEAVFATGRALAEAKRRLPHGQWADAVALMPFSERTAQLYMQLAGNVPLANPQRVAHLPSATGTLAELAQLDGDELDRLLAAGMISAEMTRGDAKALVRAAGAGKPGQIAGSSSAGSSSAGSSSGKPGKEQPAQPSLTDAEVAAKPEPAAGPAVAVTNAAAPAPGPASAVRATDVGSKPGKPDSEPPPCPGCRDLEAKLKAADEQIARLRASRPDAVLTAEKEFLADQNAALAAENAELRRSGAPIAPEQAAPGIGTDPEPQALDDELEPADADPDPDERRPCGSVHASKVVIVADGTRQRIMSPDGSAELEWLCPEHRALLADRSGATVMLVPGGDEWDVGTCQFPVPAEVPA